MGAQGTATIDFGAFPGSSVGYVDVVAVGVISTSAVEAWIRPVATADHTAEDHVATPVRIVAQYVSDGNIRVWGFNENAVIPPVLEQPQVDPSWPGGATRQHRRLGQQNPPMLVGQYNVWWVWN